LLGAVAFTAVGFVAVWQGFGLAGFGTDAHALRVLAACAALFVCGLALVWPRRKMPRRAVAALVGLGAACAAWWLIPAREGGWSLSEAVEKRDQYRERLATPTVEQFEQHGALRDIDVLCAQYPSLTTGLPADYERWKVGVADDVVARYSGMPLDDFTRVSELRQLARTLAEVHPQGANRLEGAFRQWLARAQKAQTDELGKLRHGDWVGFNHTAPGRRALAEALPESRDALVRAENEWVDSFVEWIVSNNLEPKRGEAPNRDLWVNTQKEVLALRALDPSAGRFAKARLRLFTVAHRAVQSEIAAHLGAGEEARAYGAARKHVVEWDATAALFGPEEQKKLDSLRETCEFFNALASKAAKPPEPVEIAPEPRPKP
jgi:hypothetical protein